MAEKKQLETFKALQEEILAEFGKPVQVKRETGNGGVMFEIEGKSITQTSLVVEWNELDLGKCELRGIDCFVNGIKANSYIMHKPNSLKLSGLDMDKSYQIQIVVRTSGGTLTSQTITLQTHNLTLLSGLNVTIGTTAIQSEIEEFLASVQATSKKTIVDFDTTHLVTDSEDGELIEKANKLNIPVVKSTWILACRENGKMIPVRDHYLKQ